MYVVARKVGDSFVINDKVTVTVLKITPTVVRIGVEAEDSVSVRRVDSNKPPAVDAGETQGDNDVD